VARIQAKRNTKVAGNCTEPISHTQEDIQSSWRENRQIGELTPKSAGFPKCFLVTCLQAKYNTKVAGGFSGRKVIRRLN